MTTVFAKPQKRENAPKSRPMPKCECTHPHGSHVGGVGVCARPSCPCKSYRPRRVSVRRSSPVPRTSAPKKARKIMPRCKHCAHPASKHPLWPPGSSGPACLRCSACPGYAPAIGIRQKRRTPQAALRRIADGLWSAIVHSRPGGCEIQQYHQHECSGGYQAMHGIPRTFAATRWLPINGFKGCADIHKYYTHRPEMWALLLAFAWGHDPARELWALARASQPVDMDATIASLRAEAKARGIE